MAISEGATAASDRTSELRERYFSLVLEYDGAAFHGWQRQPGGVVTVQGELERALSRLLDERVQVRGSGRTDAGVHALGQWATFRASTPMALRVLRRGLEALLPPSIGVCDLDESSKPLDALRQSVRKTYCYQLHLGRSVPLVRRRTFAGVARSLEPSRVHEAIPMLQGERDYTSFTSEASRRPSCVLRIDRIRLRPLAAGLRIFFTSPGFSYNLVRALVGALVEVGCGRWSLAHLEKVVAARDRSQGPALAPAHGLFLFRVDWSAAVAESLGRRRASPGARVRRVSRPPRTRSEAPDGGGSSTASSS